LIYGGAVVLVEGFFAIGFPDASVDVSLFSFPAALPGAVLILFAAVTTVVVFTILSAADPGGLAATSVTPPRAILCLRDLAIGSSASSGSSLPFFPAGNLLAGYYLFCFYFYSSSFYFLSASSFFFFSNNSLFLSSSSAFFFSNSSFFFASYSFFFSSRSFFYYALRYSSLSLLLVVEPVVPDVPVFT
jgi:hypothetical protein